MSETKKPLFSADRPILTAAEDKLDRRNFSTAVADAINGWSGKDSLIVAIYGEWGSGKTSVKNLVVEQLIKIGPQAPTTLEFNPWQFSGTAEIQQAFISEIERALGRSDGKESSQSKKLASVWKAYASSFRIGKFLVTSFNRFALVSLTILAAIIGSSVTVLLQDAHYAAAIVVVFVVVVSAALGWLEQFATFLSEWHATRAEALDKSLSQLKKDLIGELSKRDKPLLVVMDDLDRLDSEEIRSLLRWVKANTDLPNLVFLLLCQRNIVEWAVTEKDAPYSGRDYLEKIVQVGFDLPAVHRPQMEKILFAGINEQLRLAGIEADTDAESNRWSELYVRGIQHYFQNLRDVHRFLSAFSFQVGLFRSRGSFEVNGLDLIALEVLRLFEPSVYAKLPNAKDALTNPLTRGFGRSEDDIKRQINEVADAATETNRQFAKAILASLFPYTQKVLVDGFGGGDEQDWARRLRVASSDIFDRYFQLAIPEGDISQARLNNLISIIGNRDQLVAELKALESDGLLFAMLDRLEAYKETLPLEQAESFVTGLFDIGDRLPAFITGGIFETAPAMHAIRIVFWFLRREQSDDRKFEVFRNAIQNTTGLSLPVQMVQMEAAKKEKNRQPNEFLVSDENKLRELQQLCLSKIRAASADGRLAASADLGFLLNRWGEWNENWDEVQSWVRSIVKDPIGVGRILKANSNVVFGQKIRRMFVPSNLERFMPLDEFEKLVNQINPQQVDEETRDAIQGFRIIMERKKAGKSTDFPWYD